MTNCGRSMIASRARADESERLAPDVVLGHQRQGGEKAHRGGHAEVGGATKGGPQPQAVQLVAQARGRRVAAGWDARRRLYREHEASSTIQRTSAPKEWPRNAACSGASEVGVIPGWVLVSSR